MEIMIDHYLVLGLPSGEEGSKLTDIEIIKAYRSKALELHPDKRPNDPNANTEFQRLKTSYEILKDEEARKCFDDDLRKKRNHRQRQSQYDAKRRKMMSDIDERERASFARDPTSKTREEEERIAKKLNEEIAGIQAMRSKSASTPKTTNTTSSTTSESVRKGEGVYGEKVLKVSWERDSEDYNDQRLRELFMEFGDIEDVVIRYKESKGKKKIGCALVVMTSKDGAVAAMKGVFGDLSNPLLVLPLHKTTSTDQFTSVSPAKKYEEPIEPMLNDLVGAGYQAKEDSILQKLLKKAAEKQK